MNGSTHNEHCSKVQTYTVANDTLLCIETWYKILVALGLEDVKEEKNKKGHTDLFFNRIKTFVNLVKIHKVT